MSLAEQTHAPGRRCKNRFSVQDHIEHDKELWSLRYASSSVRGLYLHIPFCEKKCAYCDFASWKTKPAHPLMKRYVIALQHQLEHLGSIGLLDEARTAYIGGGTPSFVGEPLSWLVQTTTRWVEVGELSCEANPESFDESLAEALREQGTTRISFGVQTLQDEELQALGRIHDAKRALQAITLAQELGFSVSCDLMCGIPHQSAGSFKESLEQLISQGIDHLSIYPLTVEENTLMAHLVREERLPAPDDDLQADLMQKAAEVCERAGYHHYEVASYAKLGSECAHNLSYWQGLSYLGLGCSAASMLSAGAYRLLQSAAPQLPTLEPSTFRVRLRMASSRYEIAQDRGVGALRFQLEELSLKEAIAEDLMLGARQMRGIPPALLELTEDVFGVAPLRAALSKIQEEGLATFDGQDGEKGFLKPTQRGWLLGNRLYGELYGLALS